MDMSFHRREADAAPASRLDYPVLLALLGVDVRRAPELPVEPRCDPSVGLCLVEVVLGRPDWRAAARTLGGRFAETGRIRLAARQPR